MGFLSLFVLKENMLQTNIEIAKDDKNGDDNYLRNRKFSVFEYH